MRPPKRRYGLWVSKGTQSASATQTGENWKNKQSNSFSIFSFDLLVPSCLQPHQRLEVKGSQFTQSIKVSLLEPRVQKDCYCQSLSRVQLCNPMDCSTPGLPVHHQLPEFTQTHVHRVGDAIQPFSSSVVSFSPCPQCLPA